MERWLECKLLRYFIALSILLERTPVIQNYCMAGGQNLSLM